MKATKSREVQQLLAILDQALRDEVAKLSVKALYRTPAGRKVSNFTLLSGIAAHDLYHAGQIQLLKRLCNARRRRS